MVHLSWNIIGFYEKDCTIAEFYNGIKSGSEVSTSGPSRINYQTMIKVHQSDAPKWTHSTEFLSTHPSLKLYQPLVDILNWSCTNWFLWYPLHLIIIGTYKKVILSTSPYLELCLGVQRLNIFSSPEQKLRVSYCHHPMSVVRRLSSIVRRSSSTISLLTLQRSQFWPNLDETWSECLPLWNLGQVWYWVTWGQKLGHQVKSKEKLVNTLEVIVLTQSWWNLLKMFASIKSRSSLKLGHLGSKTRSLGQISRKPC